MSRCPYQKNWQQYRAPKWLNVVDSLQKYVCTKNGKPAGDYSYVAEMVENSFISSSLRVLLEYGVPQNAVEIIQKIAPSYRIDLNSITEDELLNFIKGHRELFKNLLKEYEFEVLERVL